MSSSPISSQTKEQLISITKQKLQKMHQDKKETPSLIIPRSLVHFTKSDTYHTFLFSIYEYSVEFNQLMKKYTVLKEKMKSRASDQTVFLNKEKGTLMQMQKELSFQYAGILLTNNGGKTAYKDQKQQFFFETLIYLISKVLKEKFPRSQFLIIQEEINRLFRTNRFNIIKRRHQKDTVMKQFPALKDSSNKQKVNLQTIINRAPEQITAYRKLEKQRKASKSLSTSVPSVSTNQNSLKQTSQSYSEMMGIYQIKDDQQRSPLICTWLPSRKNMMSQFNRFKYADHLKASSGAASTLMSIGNRSLIENNVIVEGIESQPGKDKGRMIKANSMRVYDHHYEHLGKSNNVENEEEQQQYARKGFY